MDILRMIDDVSGNVPTSDTEERGKDGLLFCKKCGKKVETEIEVLGMRRIVRCICDCKIKERQEQEEREWQQELDRRRRVCFAETNMSTWNFANDDGKNQKMSQVMKNYVDNFHTFKRDGKGLLLYGSVGTGKTYYAACIANALLEKNHRVLMTNFASLTNKLQGMFEGKQEYINSLNRYGLLIIDDLGAERNTEYMVEQVFNIIDSRYRSGLPMIITTNLTAEELKKPQEVSYSRIYDRILERCHPVKVDGASRRRENLKNSFEDTQKLLGL